MTKQDERAELRAGLEGTTPGEWAACSYVPSRLEEYEENRWICADGANIADEVPAKDAEHIARCSPAAINRLLDELDAKDTRITALEAALEGAEERGRLKGLEEACSALIAEADRLNQSAAEAEERVWLETADMHRDTAAFFVAATVHLRSLAQQERPAEGGE